MNHILVMPMHDPKKLIRPHVERITPALKEFFHSAVISVSGVTSLGSASQAAGFPDPFFRPTTISTSLPVGAQFHALYQHAAETCPPDDILHLCFPDRLAYQVESEHRQDFFASLRRLQQADLPLLYQRSPAAWATHPSNYREIEAAISMVGRWVYGRTLDFAWCHLALTAADLRGILPATRRTDMSMLAEMVIQLSQRIHTAEVDWLAWEDPFILGRPAEELKRDHEQSPAETRKRLSYALPMMEMLYTYLHHPAPPREEPT